MVRDETRNQYCFRASPKRSSLSKILVVKSKYRADTYNRSPRDMQNGLDSLGVAQMYI